MKYYIQRVENDKVLLLDLVNRRKLEVPKSVITDLLGMKPTEEEVFRIYVETLNDYKDLIQSWKEVSRLS